MTAPTNTAHARAEHGTRASIAAIPASTNPDLRRSDGAAEAQEHGVAGGEADRSSNSGISRRSLVMNMMVSASAITAATSSADAQPKKRKGDAELLRLCQQLHALLAEQKVVYDELSAASKRAEAAFKPPHEISLDLLSTPLFDGLDEGCRHPSYGGGMIPCHVIERAIQATRGTSVEKTRGDGFAMIVLRDEPAPLSAEMLARKERLQHMLEIAKTASEERTALYEAEGCVDHDDHPRLPTLTDEIDDLLSDISEMQATSPEGLLAKVSLWQTDPEFFNDKHPDDDASLAESILRDIPRLNLLAA